VGYGRHADAAADLAHRLDQTGGEPGGRPVRAGQRRDLHEGADRPIAMPASTNAGRIQIA
jgi:hypothetical protein